jgi:hypothetical protein
MKVDMPGNNIETLKFLTISWQSKMCFRISAISGDEDPMEIEWQDFIHMLILRRQVKPEGNHEVFCFTVNLTVFRTANLSAENDV